MKALLPLLLLCSCKVTDGKSSPTSFPDRGTPVAAVPEVDSAKGAPLSVTPLSARSAAPTPPGDGQDELTPPPTTTEERAAARQDPTALARLAPFVPEGTKLFGVSLLATARTANGTIDALRVQIEQEGGVASEVLILDERDLLLARLPQAVPEGPAALRLGSLSLPLKDRGLLERIGRGEVDLDAASAVLRLAGLVAQDRLLAAAAEGWESFLSQSDPDILVLGVSPEETVAPGTIPMGGPLRVPDKFRVEKVLPSTLAGWNQTEEDWQGTVRIRIQDESGAPATLVVGVQGRRPR